MTASLFRLPASTTLTPEQALQDVLRMDLQDVLIAGYDKNGVLIIRSSRMTCAEAMFMAIKAQRWSESGGQEI